MSEDRPYICDERAVDILERIRKEAVEYPGRLQRFIEFAYSASEMAGENIPRPKETSDYPNRLYKYFQITVEKWFKEFGIYPDIGRVKAYEPPEDGEPGDGKQCSVIEAIEWAWDNLHTNGVPEKASPGRRAYNMYLWATQSDESRNDFMKTWAIRLLPSKSDTDNALKKGKASTEIVEAHRRRIDEISAAHADEYQTAEAV